MKQGSILVTGSSGHLGEALMRILGDAAVGTDKLAGAFTAVRGDLTSRDFVRSLFSKPIRHVLHTATLHKPHVALRDKQSFVDTNITATLHLLEESVRAGVESFVFTSTTSAFGRALTGSASATWITESVVPVPKNIYGVTKVAAEDLCQLFHQEHGLPCIVLRTSRFFPEEDDDAARRAQFDPENLKLLELLHRRVDLEDVAEAHVLAAREAPRVGFAKLIVTATTPFRPEQLPRLATDAAAVLRSLFPRAEAILALRGWKLYSSVDRVYVNDLARELLRWEPRYTFEHALECLERGEAFGSELARAVGSKGYSSSAGVEVPESSFGRG